MIPLTKQLTNLSGNLWSRTIRGARAERIEYLLLHEFHALKYVLPEKKAFEGGGGAGMFVYLFFFVWLCFRCRFPTAVLPSTNASHILTPRFFFTFYPFQTGKKSGKGFDEDGDDDNNNNSNGNNKVGGNSRKRAKAGYAGGLVLEPKKGLYDTYILLLDFNSLYPSIIQEYNLCFTTIEWTKYDEGNAAHVGNNSTAVVNRCDIFGYC